MDTEVEETEKQMSKVSIQNKELNENEQEIFADLISNAKQLTSDGNIKDALALYKQAIKMHYHEKLARKISKMEACLQETGSSPSHEQKQRQSSSATPNKDLPISEEEQEIYKQLISSARNLVEEGKIQDALEMNKQALQIYHNEKLARKISKMEMYLRDSGDQEQQGGNSSEKDNVKDSNSEPLSGENKEIFEQLVQTAKMYTEEGKIRDALELYKEAYQINKHEKLGRKIAKIEKFLEETETGQKNRQPTKKDSDAKPNTQDVPEEKSNQQKERKVSVEDQENFNQLIQTAKLYTDEGNIEGAVGLYKEALKIYKSEKLERKIAKMEAYLKENATTEDKENQNTENQQIPTKTPLVTPGKSSKSDGNDLEKFNRLVQEAKQLTSEGKVKAALELNKQALKICHSDKLAKKIAKMEQYLEEHGDEEEAEDDENGMVHVGNGYFMFKELYSKLYDHQKEAVLWMWGLHQKKKGGILGDDMGLGKTIQIISFLSGLFDMDKVKSVLIVMPVSLIVNWEKEFQKWAPGIRVEAYHGSSKKEKERALSKVQIRGGALLTSYGLVVTSSETLGTQDGREFVWDYVILDEGHKIKNPTKTTKGVHAIPAKNRIILTGTPIQNNLKELWALFDFVHQGSLLGTARTFKMEYDTPITRARERDATVGERRLGQEMAESLKKIIAPYFLRRTKAEVTETKDGVKVKKDEDAAGKMPSLTRKNDLILWVFLTQTQQKIYEDFLSLDSVKELLMTKKSPLVALTVLKKITDHPRLLSTRAVAQLGIDDHGLDEDQLESEDAYRSAVEQIKNVDDQVLINESGKLIVLVELLDKLKAEGHRTLVFSQSRKLLDIIEKVMTNRGHHVMRLDGTITHLSERDQRMKKFQTDDKYSVFLLTTQVGGVGLTLTAADRVVIYDPSWNPATDNQAVDRAFRIGQEKNVVIYRLITCGTVEEKIYRRQIFKDSITRQTTGNTKNPYRYFTKQELKELFQLDNPRVSSTQQQLEEMHSGFRKTDQSLDAHIAYLYSLDIFGISDHDLMFGQVKDNKDDLDIDCEEDCGNDYIQARVQKAQELLKMESDLSQPMSQYPSSEGGASRARGPYEWNMPSQSEPGGRSDVPEESGPDDVIDLKDKDSDTEMVDLTETPAKPKVKEEPPSTFIKDEQPVPINESPPSARKEQLSPLVKQETIASDLEEEEPLPILRSPKIRTKTERRSNEGQICIDDNDDEGAANSSHVPQGPPYKIKEERLSNAGPICLDRENEDIGQSDSSHVFLENDTDGLQSNPICLDSDDEVEQKHLSNGNHAENSDKENDEVRGHKSSKVDLNIFHRDDYDVDMASPTKASVQKQNEMISSESPMKMDTMYRSPKIKLGDKMSVDSPMRVDSPVYKSPLRSTENVIGEEDMNVSVNKTPLKTKENLNNSCSDGTSSDKTGENVSKGLGGSVVKLFTNTVSNIVSMVSPAKQTPGKHVTPAKSKRRSVCQSPWLSRTPKTGSADVVNEEILISPDACRPLMSTGKRFNLPMTSQNLTEAKMNSTIMTMFSNSPTPQRSHSSGSSHSGGSLGQTFVDESPSPKKTRAFVQDSPESLDDSRADNSENVISDSFQNTPKVFQDHNSYNVSNMSLKGHRSRKSEIEESIVNESRNDDSPSIVTKLDDSVINESEDLHVDSPIATTKKKTSRRAVIESSDEDDDNDEKMNESVMSDDELDLEDSPKPVKSKNRIVSDDSEEESPVQQSRKRKMKNSFVDEGSEDEEEEEEDDNNYDEEDSFINDDEMSEEVSESDEEDDFDSLSDHLKNQFTNLVKTGRQLYKNKNYGDALVNILQALEIYQNDDLQALALKINKKMEMS